MSQQPSVFVIEDDTILGPIYSELIVYEHGWRVEWIRDGTAAEERLATSVPDIILLDLHLPGVSGKQLFSKIHTDERFAQTKVVIITADGVRAQDLEARADRVLLKPITRQMLLNLSDLFPVALSAGDKKNTPESDNRPGSG